MDTHFPSPVPVRNPQARRRTDALPDEDRAFVKGAAVACLVGACWWALCGWVVLSAVI